MRVSILGSLEVVSSEGVVVDVGTGRDRSVLAGLCTDAGAVVPGDRLIELVWGDRQPANPANALQKSVSRLRRALGADRIGTAKPGYLLVVDRDELDAWSFEDFVERAGRLARDDPATAAALCADALALWRGDPLPELDAPLVEPVRTRLRELRRRAIVLRASSLVELGRASEAMTDAAAAFEADPLDESVATALMSALHGAGRQAEALRVAQQHRKAVAEAGLVVGPALAVTERIVLDPVDAPALPRVPPPYYGNRFIGRDAEVAAVQREIDEHRLTTLVGPGGVGKTRLAREVALGVRSWWADLSVLPVGAEPAPAICGQLRVHPVLGASADDALADALADDDGLLVLDDCDPSVEQVATLVARLLGRCPGVRLLASSRQPLGVAGEQVVEVGPLAVGPAAPAADLFFDRARAVTELTDADRRAVAAVVDRLDGVPLAIELAAGRLAVLGMDELEAHLRGSVGRLAAAEPARPERHRSLASVVADSWSQLDGATRVVARAVGVFQGWFTVTDAAAVTGCGLVDCTEALADLRRLSLVDRDRRGSRFRFRYLSPIRDFIWAEAVEVGESGRVVGLHRAWLVDQLETARRLQRGTDEAAAVELTSGLRPDLVAALAGAGDADVESLLAPLAELVAMRPTVEDAALLTDAVERRGATAPWVLSGAAQAAFIAGDMERVAALCDAAARTPPVPWMVAWLRGSIPLFGGDPTEARRRLERSAEEADDGWESTFLGSAAAFAAANAGDDDAAALAVGIVSTARQLGNPSCLSWALCAAGAALTDRDPAGALAAYEEAAALAAAVANQVTAGLAAPRLAALRGSSADAVSRVLADQLASWQRHGNRSHAVELVAFALPVLAAAGEVDTIAVVVGALGDATGYTLQLPSDRRRVEAAVASARDAIGDDGFAERAAHGARLGIDDALTLAGETLRGIATDA